MTWNTCRHDPRRRRPPHHPYVPRGQPVGRRLRRLEAESISDARHLLESSFPDLAIIDLGLPDGDGLELIEHVRDADRIAGRLDPDLPRLVLSGRVSELDLLRGFGCGCDDYLAKPYSYYELSGGSGRCCGARGAGRAPGVCGSDLSSSTL